MTSDMAFFKIAALSQIYGDLETPLEHILKYHFDKCHILVQNPELREVLEYCFQIDFTKRPSAAQIYNHQFFFTQELKEQQRKFSNLVIEGGFKKHNSKSPSLAKIEEITEVKIVADKEHD